MTPVKRQQMIGWFHSRGINPNPIGHLEGSGIRRPPDLTELKESSRLPR